MSTAGETIVVDASALVDLLRQEQLGESVAHRLRGSAIHAPAHADAEILSALGRLFRADLFTVSQVEERLRNLTIMPLIRHPLQDLLAGAWSRRENLRLADALYVELASQLDVPLITTDRRLARATPSAEAVGG